MYFCVYFEKFPWNILPLALGIADCPLFSLLTLRSSSDFDAHCCSDENPSIRRIWSLTRELIRNVLFAWHLCCLKTPWNAIFCQKETTVMYSAVNTHIVIPQWKDINGSNKKVQLYEGSSVDFSLPSENRKPMYVTSHFFSYTLPLETIWYVLK